MIRAVKDGMTFEEYRGSFYVWAPHGLKPVVGPMLGFSPYDLERGGRLQRLNRSQQADFYEDDIDAEETGRPDRAITYYRMARAERVKLWREMEAVGKTQADADEILKERALAMIRSMPTLGVFVLPALGLLLFYALFSHFIPNYGVPTLPVVIICAMRLLGDAISAGERKWARLHGNELP
jgi:hypothetical protein